MQTHRQIFRSTYFSLTFSLLLLLIPAIGFSADNQYHCDDDMAERIIKKADLDGRPINFLMLSGGGSFGSWGAGFIEGWWQNSGKDVELDMITGISAGSIVSVYVYLQELEELHQKFLITDTRDFYRGRFPLFIPFASSVFSTNVQRRILMPRLFPNELIDRMAAKSLDENAPFHCIGSTKLSTGEFVEWDMVKIAKAKDYKMFRRVMQSAIAFPVMFEPVRINGELYVDGGVRRDVFVDMGDLSLQTAITLEETNSDRLIDVPQEMLENFNVLSLDSFRSLSPGAQALQLGYAASILIAADHKPNAYIVINGKTSIGEAPGIRRKLLPLAERSMAMLLKGSLYGSLYKIYYDMVKDETTDYWDFKYTQVPEDFDKSCIFIEFKISCTTKLWDKAFAAGSKSEPWVAKFPAF